MQSERRRSKDLFKQFIKLFKKIGVEEIADQTRVDEFSKKLGMREHLLIMLWYVIGDCITLTELSDSLKGILSERYKLIEISKSQLSKVNKKRDYRAFVWAFYELIDLIWRDRKHWRMKRGLKIIGLDSTFIVWKSKYSKFGYCGLTGETEEGIRIHTSALLEPLTIPLTVMITPGDVHDSLEFDDLLEDSNVFIDLRNVVLVFDKGYWKLNRFKKLGEKGYRFITPMKINTKYEVLSKKIEGKISDETIKLSNGSIFRSVTSYTSERTERYLTNLDLPPEEIKEIYGMRWSIEIFFREIKSYLKIERFIGKNLNAVLIQIFSTLIAYVLIALLKTFYKMSILEIKRGLKHGIGSNRSVQLVYSFSDA